VLILHAGAHEIDYDGLRSVPTPEPTATHHPLPHHELVNQVMYALTYYGHEVVKQQFAILPDGSRFFGTLMLKSDYGDYTDMVGLANSHNKTVPVSVCFGSQVFVCDNLAFSSEVVVKRKHTANSRRQLPGIVQEIIEPLRARRLAQNTQFERYKGTHLTDGEADQIIMQMFRRGIINVTRIPEVLEQWENPQVDYGPKTAYRLFNGATWSLKPKVADKPALTQELHTLMDSVCIEGQLAA
jgi:hypothetical protein